MFKNKILALLVIMGIFFVFCSDVKANESHDAVAFFNRYVTAANNYSAEIGPMYSPSAKIIRQVVKPDGTTVDIDTDTDTYLKQLRLGQAGAKLRNYKNTYTNITCKKLGEGTYKVSSLRQPTGETYKLKTYMILKKQPNGSWLIVEELMQTKVQQFLRYAK